MSSIKEDLIQFIWQHRLFDFSNLKTIHGEPIELIKSGFLNTYDGPDFSDARIVIGAIEWAGTVEIHVKDVDWLKHGHQEDKKYGSVILHVVWEVQSDDSVPKGIPCLVLKDYVSSTLLEHYRRLMNSVSQLSCDDYVSQISSLEKTYAIEQKSFERLRRKAAVSEAKLKEFGGDWLQLLFWMFALALGKKANKQAMEELVERVQMKYLLKCSDDRKSLEAMLFGVAGLIESEDSYGIELQKEYQFLSQKYGLESMTANSWNYSKVRGASRPELSIVILSVIVESIHKLNDIKSIDSTFFSTLELPQYWKEHHKIGVQTKRKNSLTKGLIEHLRINVIVPYLNLLGVYYNDDTYFEKAQAILELIKPESNSIVKKFVDRGFEIENSYQSQGTIELYNEYCQPKECLSCHIGKKILNKV